MVRGTSRIVGLTDRQSRDGVKAVTAANPTIGELISRFALRQRASTEEFNAGVRLARRGAVHVNSASGKAVQAQVIQQEVHLVLLEVRGRSLFGQCTCSSAPSRDVVCCHQVATAHTLWMQADHHHHQ